MTTNTAPNGNPHMRFNKVKNASVEPKHGSLLNKKMLSCVIVFAATVAFAADVAFTGGGTDACDLADAANWGGTLPGAGDVGVIDCSQHGYSFLAKSDVSFGGLSFTANNNVIYIEDGGKTISIGAGGVVLARGCGFLPKGKWNLTADQTWSMANGVLDSRATYSGSAVWTINAYQSVNWTSAPRYGGKIAATSMDSGTSTYVMRFNEAAPVATEMTVAGSVVFAVNARVTLSTLFSGKNFKKTGWSDVTILGPGPLVVDEGSTFDIVAANLFQITKGAFVIDGGTVKGAAAVEMGSVNGTQGTGENGSPAELAIQGGSFTMNQMHVGAQASTNRTVVQSGGTVEACSYHVGGHGNDRRASAPVEEYVLSGGTIGDKTGAARDRGLVLASGTASAANGYSRPGVFTQTGGTANFDRVCWGAQGGFWTWDDWNTEANGRGYGLLDLRGGTFNLPPSGLNLGRMWNAGEVKESAYDVKLRGVTVNGGRDKDIGLALTVAAGEQPTVWNTQAKCDRIAAPVDGDGVLRKTGSGTLALTDATRFTGSLEIAEGTVDLQGVPQEPTDFTAGSDCYVLTGDDLATTLEHGAAVTSWSDSTGTMTARQMTSGDVAKPATYGVPTLATNVFNGHAGVRFSAASKQALAFPNTGNPLAGTEQYTVAVVFKATMDGQGSEGAGNSYAGRMILGNFRNWRSKPNFMGVTIDSSNRLYYEARRHDGTTSKETGKLYSAGAVGWSAVSVALVSLDAEQMSLCLNNGFTSLATTLGVGRPRFVRSDTGETYPLYIGASDTDETDAQSPRCFDGYIAEIRIYRNRALSLPEQRAVLATLAKTYGGAALGEKFEREASGPMAASLADGRTAPATVAPDVEWTAEFCDRNLAACSGCTKPELVSNAWANGASALRFDAAKQTALDVAAESNPDPLRSQKTFTLAFVFRATKDGTGGNLVKEHVGIYSSMLKDFGSGHSYDNNNSGCGNAAVTFVEGGGISAFHGSNYDNGSVINPRKPCRLDDGLPHVVVYSGDGGDTEPVRHGKFRLMVDGVLTEGEYGYGTTWPGYDSTRPHVIGALRAGVGHFTGDIAGFQFWRSQLTAEEMRAISEKAALEYGFNLKGKAAFAASELTVRGLGATNITVAAGATFRAPYSATAPFTLGAGISLAGEGRFEGSYRFGAGTTVDFATLPALIDDVQVADGVTLVFHREGRPVDGANISSIAGNVTLDVTELFAGRPKGKEPLLAIPAGRFAGATFSLKGALSTSELKYNSTLGVLTVVTPTRTCIIVR